MSKKHREDDWFIDVKPVTSTIEKNPHFEQNREKYQKIASRFCGELFAQCRKRLYTGDIRGSRTSRVKRIIKNVNYWMLQWFASSNEEYCIPKYRLEQVNTGRNSFGDETRDYTLDINTPSWDLGYGRVVIRVFEDIQTELVASKFKRWFVAHFPKWHDPLKDKYLTSANVIFRIWFTPTIYCDIVVYKIKVNTKIFVNREMKEYEKQYEQGRIRQYFESKEFL